MTDDADLLRAYAATGSHPAFAQLVARHLDFVYASALRQTRSTALADDVTQSVFLHLARHALKLRPDTHLKSWLCVITRHKAIDAIRAEARRRQREHTAATLSAMDAVNSSGSSNLPDSTWHEVSPTIDAALAALSETDRRTLLLRFFEEKSLREIGDLLSLTEDTAQKRLTRALEKLRASLARRGITTTAALLAAQLPLHAATAAPAALSSTLTSPSFLTSVGTVPLGSTVFQSLVMTVSKKSFPIAALTLAACLAIFEAFALANINQHATVNELHAARLKNEVAALHDQLTQKPSRANTPHSHSPAASPESLDASLLALLERAALLQRLLETLPEERIPELRLLTDTDWLAVAADYSLRTAPDADWALSQIRNKARHRLDPLLRSALQKFLQASGDILPETPLALRPFCDPPVDDVILARYEMVRTGTATDAGPRNVVIREKKSSTDNSIDTLSETAMMGTHYATVELWRPSRLTQELLDSLRPVKTAGPLR
ncbi:MAG: sigma-70 family RNA polymerase sigma factor [Nibricoccus sp.]